MNGTALTHRAVVAVVLVALAGSPLHALEAEACKPKETEAPNDAFLRCSEETRKQLAAAAAPKANEVEKKVSAQASSASAADASDSRVSDSLADLLPLLQGAITPVNTAGGGAPVVLNFNSPPFLRGKTSLQATLAEPKIFKPLGEQFVSAVRDTETKKLLDRAGGFGDPTYSLGWAPVRHAGNWSTKRQLFGRDTKTYLPLIDEYSEILLKDFTEQATAINNRAEERLVAWADQLGELVGLEFDVLYNETAIGQLRTKAKASSNARATELLDQIVTEIAELAALEGRAQAVLDDREALEKKFAYLIGNQPDLQVRTSYRDADPAVGPRDFAVSVEYSAGTLNFNRLLEEYQARREQRPDTSGEILAPEALRLKQEAFDEIADRAVKGDLWRTSYAITYKKISDYDVKFAYKVDGVDHTALLAAPGVEEWKARLNFSHLAGPEVLTATARPRLEYSIEGTWVQEDADIPEALRRQDRVLGRVTYTVPTTDNLTFPVSIVFANRAEFLDEDKELKNRLSAHVGLSYKLPKPAIKKP